MSELVIDSVYAISDALKRITIVGPLSPLQWSWHWQRVQDGCVDGWIIYGSFERIDRDTGEVGRGQTRSEYVRFGATNSSLAKTCWVILELTLRHEAMESFRVDGALVFDPHRTIDELKCGAA